ncbi:amidohydrolase family protein [Ideonella sp. DXS29W]|uniref:Amidohydrolase family protein n=1 Tax=Ideonella lacteola TaxID=2984193 RepID=A0ABU9BJB5_9BURK
MADFARVPKIDAHVHLHGTLPQCLATARRDGFRLLTINAEAPDFPGLDEQQRDAVALAQAHPEQVAWVVSLPFEGFESTTWWLATEARLQRARALGAQGVKVWKNLGLSLRDSQGRAVLIDDERLRPLFDLLDQDGWVLLGHQAEPRNAWLPLAQMTTRGDREYFATHPQYHLAQHPEWPDQARQLAARDHLLRRHPRLRYVGVHLASLEWSVARLAEFLDRFPQATVDLAARMSHLQHQAIDHHDEVRAFMLRYQDRLLYGTDLSVAEGQRDAEVAAEAHATWRADWRFLVTREWQRHADLPARFRGLDLPATVIDKLYRRNAERVFPAAWSRAWRYDRSGEETTPR